MRNNPLVGTWVRLAGQKELSGTMLVTGFREANCGFTPAVECLNKSDDSTLHQLYIPVSLLEPVAISKPTKEEIKQQNAEAAAAVDGHTNNF